MVNPFQGYLERFHFTHPEEKMNPIREIVKTFHELKGTENKGAAFYRGRYAYGKLAREAKSLFEACGDNIDDALWCLDKMKYKAEKGGFDWSISTCLKHNLQ